MQLSAELTLIYNLCAALRSHAFILSTVIMYVSDVKREYLLASIYRCEVSILYATMFNTRRDFSNDVSMHQLFISVFIPKVVP